MASKERGAYVDIMAVQKEVTGSCILGVAKFQNETTTRFIIDCGMFQEEKYSQYNSDFPFDPSNIDFCIATHNHVDHTGRLPLLQKQGFTKKIYVSKPTSYLLPLALEDSYKVVKEMAKRNFVSPLYSSNNVTDTISQVKAVEYGVSYQVSENIKLTMFKNGHLPGAAIVLVQISSSNCDDINILFTGDYNNKNLFLDVPDLPDWVLELPLTIVQESTYGTTNSSTIEKCFRRNVAKCIENGGSVVIPAFALGRYQEILYEFKCMQKEGVLPLDVEIFAAGNLAHRYTDLFVKGKLDIKDEMLDFLPENLNFVGKHQHQDVMNSAKSKIVLTTSGAGTYGPAPQYIQHYIRQPNALIHFTGFTPEGTLGARLKNAQKGEVVSVAGLFPVKRADVQYTTEFSAHAKADEMIDFLKQFKNLKLVLVNHGEMSVQDLFAERVVREVDPKNVGILGRDYFYRINPYGLVKTLSTKF